MGAGTGLRFPAEWERHDATWIAWPHHEPDWPGKLAPIPWVYGEIVRVLHARERVEILCHDDAVREDARTVLAAHGVAADGYRLHLVPNDRVWLRDSAPTFVHDDGGGVRLVNWRFNAWAKYDNYSRDERVGEAVARHGRARRPRGRRHRNEWARAPARDRGVAPLDRAGSKPGPHP
jgi:agmatine deiminase